MHNKLYAILKRVSKKDLQYAVVDFPDGTRHEVLLDINPRLNETLIDFFGKNIEFDNFQKYMINFGGGSSGRVDFPNLARNLATATVELGPARTTAKLRRFLENDTLPHETILYLYGPKVPQQVRLSNNISIIPFNRLPHDFRKLYFRIAGLPEQTTEVIPLVHRRYLPTCAVLGVSDCHPKWITKDGDTNRAFQRQQVITQFINETALLLCLIGLKASRQLVLVDVNSTWLPTFGQSYSVRQLHGIKDAQYYESVWSVGQARSFRKLHSLYFALGKSQKERLRIPMERLNQAMGRFSIVDAAIDLGIVLESLLTSDAREDAPITHLIRTRGAKFLGKTLEERKTIDSNLREAYRCRNIAVHTGQLKPKTSNRDTKALIDAGASLSASIICKMIYQGIPSREEWIDISYT